MRISVDSHRNARVRLNGVDISNRCFAADDTEGWADCYKINSEGLKYVVVTNGEKHAAEERLYGLVQIDIPKRPGSLDPGP